MKRTLWRNLIMTSALIGAGMAQARIVMADEAHYVIIQNSETVGRLDVAGDAKNVTLDYFVDDNGRGPKHKQVLTLDDSGLPLKGAITGTSLMGGKVDESFSLKGKNFSWVSQADQGKLSLKTPRLYIINDSNPYDLAIYARYLLKQPNQTADVLPGGTVRLTTLQSLTIGEGDKAIKVTAYQIDGLDMDPAYILLDDKGELFASGSMIRKGYEAEMAKLGALTGRLSAERQTALQAKLAHSFAGVVRIKNVRIFDPKSGQLSGLSSVFVVKDRIATILPEEQASAGAPEDETIIDGEGGTLVSGLHDMHAHLSRSSGLMLLAAGVTSVRDMGNVNTFLDAQMTAIDKGEIAGPRVIRNGFLEGRSPYSARHGIVVGSEEDALKAVRWYADNGFFQLKIYNSFNPAWVKSAAAESHRLGMKVVGHIPAFYTPDQAILDGYDEITHLNQLVLGWVLKPDEDTRTPLRLTGLARTASLDLNSAPVQKTLDLMKTHQTSLDTTIVIIERLMLSRAGTFLPDDRYYMEHMPIGYQRYRKRSYVTIKTPEEDASYTKSFDKLIEIVGMLHKNGVPLLPGTDDGLGISVKRELELYVKAGMTPAEALRVATYDMEKYFGRDQQLGSIERGKLADFFLVRGDPTRDINALHDMRMVLKGGYVYFPNEIYDALGIKPFTTAPKVIAPLKPRPATTAQPAGDGFDADYE
jgi:hypothetical protein